MKNLIAFGLAVLFALPAFSAERSAAQVRAFKKQAPCPATGLSRGRCVGWEVDHRIPLKCGGLDVPANMRWLTVQEHKVKTAREARWCRKARS